MSPPANNDSSDHSYYDKSREDVIALIPEGARNVIDAGCAAGGLGRVLRARRPGVRVRGIEPVAEQAERARAALDDVVVGYFDAETRLPATWPAPDCIVFADVIEHMVDPWGAVRRACALLAPGGSLVCSIPNVAHWSATLPVVCGRFDYQDYGVLDRTHLRFFTRRTAIELVESAGLRVQRVARNLAYHEGVFDERWLRGALSSLLRLEDGRRRSFPPPLGRIADLLTVQFLLVAS
jgi:2-polyprenyl-3-methyl-5-hydroxy-6-metoxy-1,4-benzoquinol methylase